jgi:hypothetical protein
MMKTRMAILTVAAVVLCGASPDKTHPLNLNVPDPTSALRLAWWKAMPDETVLEKVANLEKVTRAANPNASQWRIYLTPDAAAINVKGWEADNNRPDTPVPELSLGDCIRWLCRHVPDLQFEVLNDRILIEKKESKTEHNQQPEGIRR